MYSSKITGVGHYVPENIVTNEDLSKLMDTNDAWIEERTGIKERRHIKKGDGNSTSIMGVKASRIALERAGLKPEDIDMIVFATLSPDMYFPGGGVQVQEMMGMRTIPALDVRNQCSGFVYSLSVADQFIKTGMYKHVLVVGSENHSGGLDFTTRGRGVSVIFGDGAGAVVVSRNESNEGGILSTHLHSEGKHKDELALQGPTTQHWVPEIITENDQENIPYYPYMNGQFVFKHAVVRFSQVIMEGLEANNLTTQDIDMFIPHQANLRISQYI
jgi:3-oxoacyl-[acyl-carrier-protein] synthase-3